MPGTYISPAETKLYYLQSRYYNPEIGRFINADAYASTGEEILGCNMFAYCGNNPVMGYDPTGNLDWQLQSKLMFGATLFIIGVAIILAVPSGGTSLAGGSAALTSLATLATGTSLAVAGTAIVSTSLPEAAIYYSKPSKLSGKEKANDKPSWVSRSDIDPNKNGRENATDLLNQKYGKGNWSPKSSKEFSWIKKWVDRGLKVLIFALLDEITEDN